MLLRALVVEALRRVAGRGGVGVGVGVGVRVSGQWEGLGLGLNIGVEVRVRASGQGWGKGWVGFTVMPAAPEVLVACRAECLLLLLCH